MTAAQKKAQAQQENEGRLGSQEKGRWQFRCWQRVETTRGLTFASSL